MMNYGGDYAGFWRRFFAYWIDLIIVIVVGIVAQFLFGPDLPENPDLADRAGALAASQAPVGIIYVLYYVLLTASPLRATFGKFVLDAAVVDSDGNTIGILRGLWREFMKVPSAIILYIGFIMAGFTSEKRALHDYLSGTFVVKASESPVEFKERGPISKTLNYGTAALMLGLTFWMFSMQQQLVDSYATAYRNTGLGEMSQEDLLALEKAMKQMGGSSENLDEDQLREAFRRAGLTPRDTASERLTEAPQQVRQPVRERDYSAVIMLAEKVEEHAVAKQKFPTRFLDLGISRGDVLEQGVQEVSVGKNGVLHVAYASGSSVGDAKLVMAPYVSESGHVQWSCRSMQLSDQDLPPICSE